MSSLCFAPGPINSKLKNSLEIDIIHASQSMSILFLRMYKQPVQPVDHSLLGHQCLHLLLQASQLCPQPRDAKDPAPDYSWRRIQKVVNFNFNWKYLFIHVHLGGEAPGCYTLCPHSVTIALLDFCQSQGLWKYISENWEGKSHRQYKCFRCIKKLYLNKIIFFSILFYQLIWPIHSSRCQQQFSQHFSLTVFWPFSKNLAAFELGENLNRQEDDWTLFLWTLLLS